MISEEKYIQLVQDVLKINIEENLSQKEAILSSLNEEEKYKLDNISKEFIERYMVVIENV